MTIEQLTDKFTKHQNYLTISSGKISRKFNCTREDVIAAKAAAREKLKISNPESVSDKPKDVESVSNNIEDTKKVADKSKLKLNKEKVSDNGDIEVELYSETPMTRQEIEAHYGVDNISTTLSIYWNKAHPSGKYLVSALIKCHHDNFYSEEQLATKLKEIFSETRPIEVVRANDAKEKICVLYISDEHIGALNNVDDVHGNFYSPDIYIGRLEQIVKEVLDTDSTYEKLYIINLGDEADSQLDSMTTRKGHILPSENSKIQFDTYIKGRKILFESIFSSGIAKDYEVINCNNSNHSGNYLSYIWGEATRYWLEARYPDVTLRNVTKFIDHFQYGNHVIAYCHGKDDRDMKVGMPLQITQNVDGWLLQWFDNLGFSATKNWLHVRKGDLHTMNYSQGKFGDYISMPSVYGSSSWIGLNFGKSRAGAYYEVFKKDSPSVQAKFIWF